VLPGLVRYDEVAAGEIHHAIRFTVPRTRKAYVWPARHYASSLTALNYPPMGQRFRLKADFDVSRFSAQVQVILRALKKYGMILADNGSAWYISGVPDPRWDNDVLLSELKLVKGSDFEAVDVSSLMVSPNSGEAIQSSPPKKLRPLQADSKSPSGTGLAAGHWIAPPARARSNNSAWANLQPSLFSCPLSPVKLFFLYASATHDVSPFWWMRLTVSKRGISLSSLR
jgi:hypothetical protein